MIRGLFSNPFVSHQQPVATGSRVAPAQSNAPVTPGDTVGNLPSGFSLSGADFRFEIPANQQVTIGRLPGSGMVLEDQAVSRNHAVMRVNQGRVELCDVGSSFGTMVNGHKLEPKQWVALPPNATVSFATVDLKLGSPESASAPSSGPAQQGTPLPPDAKISMGEAVIQLQGVGAPQPLSQQGFSSALQAATGAIGGPVGFALKTGLQLSDLSALAGKQQLESKQGYLESLSGAQAQLNKESGIVDLPKGVPTMVLSDLHARRDFIMKALEHEVGGVKVFDLLKQGKMNLVCVGDGMHAEGRAAQRWLQAENDMLEGKPSSAMHQEMIEGFGTMKMVMELKSEFPENFHFLRGNHDEIKGSFAKYARRVGEAAMVQGWVQKNLGQDFLDQYAKFEESMPLVVRGQGFVASHAAPGGTLDRQAVEHRDAEAFAQLAWTENRNWNDQDGQVQQNFQHNLKEVGGEGGRWLVGHRPVEDGNYRSQFGGQLVQINAPNDFVAALVPADGKFQPQRDVITLG